LYFINSCEKDAYVQSRKLGKLKDVKETRGEVRKVYDQIERDLMSISSNKPKLPPLENSNTNKGNPINVNKIVPMDRVLLSMDDEEEERHNKKKEKKKKKTQNIGKSSGDALALVMMEQQGPSVGGSGGGKVVASGKKKRSSKSANSRVDFSSSISVRSADVAHIKVNEASSSTLSFIRNKAAPIAP
jgi:hypothetical protein